MPAVQILLVRSENVTTVLARPPRAIPLTVVAPHLATGLFFFTFAGQAVRNLVGWTAFAVLAAALLLVVLAVAWTFRRALRHSGLPIPLVVFLGVSAASLLWSDYQWATLLGIATQWATAAAGILIAAANSWESIQSALSRALRAILASSLLFELLVSTVVGHPVLPRYLDVSSAPGAFYWSENHLFELGPIQGIVGNRNLLAFIALLSLLLTCVSAAQRRRVERRDLLWAGLAVTALALTRSATVVLALVAVAIVTALLLAIRRVPARRRAAVYAAGWTLLGIGLVASAGSARAVLAILGRDDTSGRTEIWRTVADLAERQPLFGWGWISYWAPWVPPYDGLIVIDGVEYLQAHNALLDIWLQLGVVGVLAALAVALTVALGTWRMAADGLPATGRTAAPLLLLTALLFQSLTESRLLIEGNWMLLVVLCCVVASARRARPQAVGPVRHRLGPTPHTLYP